MNCPKCLSVMYNRDEIHQQGEYVKMNLHCNNNCNQNYTPWMQVLAKPNETWIANAYGLVIDDYLLEGNRESNFTKISKNISANVFSSPIFTIGLEMPVYYLTTKISYNKLITSINFHYLSTGNDLHIKARELIDNLLYLS